MNDFKDILKGIAVMIGICVAPSILIGAVSIVVIALPIAVPVYGISMALTKNKASSIIFAILAFIVSILYIRENPDSWFAHSWMVIAGLLWIVMLVGSLWGKDTNHIQ